MTKRLGREPLNSVLATLPIPHHLLQARFCGPYTVERKVNEVDYVVYIPEHHTQRRLCMSY